MRHIIQKAPRYENRRLLDLCHGEECVINFPGCTGGTNPDEPSVPAHGNSQSDGRGMNYKTHDYTACPACPSCHFQLDHGTLYTREQKREAHERGQKIWRDRLWRRGLIKVA